ncbi:hypothetical protein EGT74_10320 [Chitinophaga lutea]|uniref:IPT/TIG domain-containing protein n=1 Tax=Chitinophaga lutea TaxID=2488634 RepID=A0A3N4Q8J8_9BACT|nr:IPT/TIG domain-containing protein [Chitinophaga lutea]RPE13881.1 hypothetical protein EGT74_10320 [Chitinophaga lutea]
MKNIVPRKLLTWSLLLAAACTKDNGGQDNTRELPVIQSISPDKGPQGTSVTILGLHFSAVPGNNTVTFNNVAATVTQAETGKLVVMVPKGAGTGPVTVTVNGKTANGPAFTYQYGFTVTTLAGGTKGYADGTGAAAMFDSPSDVCTDNDGNVYVADRLNQRIRKVTPAGVVTTLAGSTLGYVDGHGVSAKFSMPRGVAMGGGGIYVADETSHRIRKVALDGWVTTIAGNGQAGFKDTTAPQARFYHPYDVAVSKYGSIFVVDQANHRIRKIRNGQVTTLAGRLEGRADGEGADAKFAFPWGIAVSPGGAVYIADGYDNGVRKLEFKSIATGVLVDEDTATTIPTTKVIISTLLRGGTGDADGDLGTAKIELIYNLGTDAAGNIYLADGGSQKVRMVTPAGQVLTVAGSYPPGYLDGSGTAAKFRHAGGVAVDKQGNIYLADTHNHCIRKITPE